MVPRLPLVRLGGAGGKTGVMGGRRLSAETGERTDVSVRARACR